MITVLRFCSTLALALAVVLAIAIAVTGSGERLAGLEARIGDLQLDYPSLIAGMGLGAALTTLARISWFELPRRALMWLRANDRLFYRLAWALVCLAILLLY